MGWGNPFVLVCLIGGALALTAFIFIEQRVPDPMFNLELFKRKMFSMGNVAGFLASLARGGLNFILIIWLQGIWLPLHGIPYTETPLWAGIYMLPTTFGFMIMGPISGVLSDQWGARALSSAGMLLTALGFAGLMLIPVNFAYWTFAVAILVIGLGMGMFVSPNLAAIMNSVPAEHRGASSGMRSTVANTANTVSLTWVFAIVTLGLAAYLPSAMYQGLTQAGIPVNVAQQVSHLPPTGAMFAAFLGYNPMQTMLPPSVIQQLPANSQALLLSKTFFPNLIAVPFDDGLRIAFLISIVISIGAAVASMMTGPRFIYEQEHQPQPGIELATDPPLAAAPPKDDPCVERQASLGKVTASNERPC